MIHSSIDPTTPKGWFLGPWNSNVSIPIGYANENIDITHFHAEMYEIYLIAKGYSLAKVGDKEIRLKAGDILVVEPGEVHTFTESSEDYLHFVIQSPFIKGDKTVVE